MSTNKYPRGQAGTTAAVASALLSASVALFLGLFGQQSGTVAAQVGATYNLAFSTYLGGSDGEQARDVATDSEGNIYVTGGTMSPDFPTTPGAFQRIHNPGTPESAKVEKYDVFVTKYTPRGRMIWSTLIGGPNYDRAYAIEVDRQGYVYIAGRAGKGFPVTPGAFQTTFMGGSEAHFYGNQNGFVCKLKPDGSGLVWSSYFGGSDYGIVRDLDIDKNGDVYIAAGYSGGKYTPAVNDAFLNAPNGGRDVVIAKIKADGSQLLWARYVGGSGDEDGAPSIRVDGSGVYVAGRTDSIDFPTTPGAYSRTYSGGGDIFVTKFSLDGRNQLYGTYLGGSKADHASNTHNLAIDKQGNAYVTSHTFSSDFPTTSGAFDRTYNGGSTGVWANDGDFSVSKLSADGSQLLGSTYIGGSSGDGPPEGLSMDQSGNVYFTGGTRSTDFPVTADAFQKTLSGSNGSAVVKLSANFNGLLYASYMPGALRASTIDSDENIIVVGFGGPGWPLVNAYQSSYGGGSSDIVVAKFAKKKQAKNKKS